jgi:hypothetical protein
MDIKECSYRFFDVLYTLDGYRRGTYERVTYNEAWVDIQRKKMLSIILKSKCYTCHGKGKFRCRIHPSWVDEYCRQCVREESNDNCQDCAGVGYPYLRTPFCDNPLQGEFFKQHADFSKVVIPFLHMVELCTSDKSTSYGEWVERLSGILLTLQEYLVGSVLGRIYEYSGDCIDCIMQHGGIKAILLEDIPSSCPVCIKSQSVSKDSQAFVDQFFGTDMDKRIIISDSDQTNNKDIILYMLRHKLIHITPTDDYDLINLTAYGKRTFETKM